MNKVPLNILWISLTSKPLSACLIPDCNSRLSVTKFALNFFRKQFKDNLPHFESFENSQPQLGDPSARAYLQLDIKDVSDISCSVFCYRYAKGRYPKNKEENL